MILDSAIACLAECLNRKTTERKRKEHGASKAETNIIFGLGACLGGGGEPTSSRVQAEWRSTVSVSACLPALLLNLLIHTHATAASEFRHTHNSRMVYG